MFAIVNRFAKSSSTQLKMETAGSNDGTMSLKPLTCLTEIDGSPLITSEALPSR